MQQATPKSKYWVGKARIGRGWAAFVGMIGDNALHRHHAIQGFVGDGAVVHERTGPISGAGFVVPSDCEHRAETRDGAAFLYIDPDISMGQTIARCLDAMRVLDAAEASNFRSIVAAALERGEDAAPLEPLARLLGSADAPMRPPIDDRIARLIDRAHTSPRLESAATAAASIGVSESRLLHLFKDEVGVPWRSFLLWTKLRRALEAVATGATLTEAAQAGGFADSAHFSRTCRTMFGINPHAMTRALAFRQ